MPMPDRAAISSTDVREAKTVFDDAGFPLPQRYFFYDAMANVWELYRIQPNGTKTLVATLNDGTTDWDLV